MFIVAWNFSNVSQFFLLVIASQSPECLLGWEYSRGLSESPVSSENHLQFGEEQHREKLPSITHRDCLQEGSWKFKYINREQFSELFRRACVWVWGSTHMCAQAVGICKQHKVSWFVSPGPRCASCAVCRTFILSNASQFQCPYCTLKGWKAKLTPGIQGVSNLKIRLLNSPGLWIASNLSFRLYKKSWGVISVICSIYHITLLGGQNSVWKTIFGIYKLSCALLQHAGH